MKTTEIVDVIDETSVDMIETIEIDGAEAALPNTIPENLNENTKKNTKTDRVQAEADLEIDTTRTRRLNTVCPDAIANTNVNKSATTTKTRPNRAFAKRSKKQNAE